MGRATVPMIREAIVTTVGADGRVHVAPFGLTEVEEGWVIAPFRPSASLDNLRAVPFAVASHVDDVRVFAGCLTGRREWATVPRPRLAAAIAHQEMEVVRVEEDVQRPRFVCRVVHEEAHAPFPGHNRAQAAVIEGAVLVSRLFMLPREKVDREVEYLRIAVEKTAGPREREAWEWLMGAVAEFYARQEANQATATAGAQSAAAGGAEASGGSASARS
jgi:uncharacterized protein